MAVSVKSLNGLAAIKHAGVDDDLYDWLHYSGFQVKLTATQFEFRHPEFPPDKQIITTVSVKMSQLHQLQQGTMKAADLAEIQVELEAAIHTLKDYPTQPSGHASPQSALAILPKGKSGESKEPTPPKWFIFDSNKVHTAEPVQLAEAVALYQPVRGTSANSRYFLVAANDYLRIGARWRPKHNSLSIRIEGEGFTKHKKNITEAGFEPKKDYASLHLACTTETVARKALGAVIMGLGVTIETPIPDLSVIAEK